MPGGFIGPFVPGYTIPDGSLAAFSTNILIYNLLRGDGPLPPHSAWVDIRDVAAAIIAALRASASEVGRKRFILAADAWYSPQEVAQYIAKERPELAGRLSGAWKSSSPETQNILDSSRAKETLGIRITPLKTTILSAVDSIIEIENDWGRRGVVPH